MPTTMHWACDTRQGPRPRNEDSVQVVPGLAAAVLADGMGGAAGGQQASSLAIATAVEFLERQLPLQIPPAEVPEKLEQLVEEVNRRVFERGSGDPALHGMGSTLVVLVTRGDRYYCANVGDSRAFLVRGGAARQISKDHSLVQERVDAGLIAPEEASRQPDRNVLTRAIGTTPEVASHQVEGELLPGDRLVMTSDGVHGVVDEERLAAASTAAEPAGAARELVELALSAGTRDNATAAVGHAAEAAPDETLKALDQVLSYRREETAPPRGAASGAGTRWLLAGCGLLAAAVALAVWSLR